MLNSKNDPKEVAEFLCKNFGTLVATYLSKKLWKECDQDSAGLRNYWYDVYAQAKRINDMENTL